MTDNVVLAYLKSNRLASVASVSSSSGAPHVSLVYYVVDEVGDIFFASASDSSKVKDFKKNAKVGLMIGNEIEPKSIQLEGTVEFVDSIEMKMQTLIKISAVANSNPHSLNLPPLVKLLKASDLVILKIVVDRFKYSDFSQTELVVIEGTKKDFISQL